MAHGKTSRAKRIRRRAAQTSQATVAAAPLALVEDVPEAEPSSLEAAEALALEEVGERDTDEFRFAVLRHLGQLEGFAPAGDGDGDGDEEAEPGPDAPFTGTCAECAHDADMHAGQMNDGACSMEGCSCQEFDEGGSMTAATAEILWDEEDGFYDLCDDLYAALNPEGSWRWWVVDIKLDASSALLCDGDENEYYIAPFTIGDDREPVLSAANEWTTVDSAWIAESGLATALRARALQRHVEAAIERGEFRFTLTDFAPVAADAAPVTDTLFTGGARWISTLCPEGLATEDGRIFAPGSIGWRDLPLSLAAMIETAPGHDGAKVCGRIDQVWREAESGLIRATGEFDSNEWGQEVARLVGNQTLRGVSVDIAPIQVEVAKRSDVVDEDGRWIEQAAEDDGEETEKPDMLDLLFGDDDLITIVREGKIGMATVCPFPAFAQATIEVENSLAASNQSVARWTVTSEAGWLVKPSKPANGPESAAEGTEAAGSITASAAGLAPVRPPAEWFQTPEFETLTPLTVDDDGRVYGHAAAWGTCHTGIPGTCTTAPTSETDYAYFHLKEVACEEGERVAVGTITLKTGHASLDLGRAAATEHYDHTGTAVADVRVGEDDHGIWFTGALRPDVDEHLARELRGATLSGDWRAVRFQDGSFNREMIALLAVNVPGFPVPRPQVALAASAGGEMEITAQIAAGMHAGQEGVTLLAERKAEVEAHADEFAALAEKAANL